MKRYKITIKMVKEIAMDHEQVNAKQAKKDIQRFLEGFSEEDINELFDSKPKFIYKVEVIH